jgi:hypothetical protein
MFIIHLCATVMPYIRTYTCIIYGTSLQDLEFGEIFFAFIYLFIFVLLSVR